MAKIGVFDLCSFFWTVAGTRKRGEDPYGLALQVLRYVKACAEKVGVEDVIFGADGPSGRSFRRSVCADYKAGREAKDPEMVAELAALEAALVEAGFTVSTIAVGPVGDVDGTAEYFEGDDVVASFAVTILKDPTAEVCIGSNDWDLAPLLAFPKVRLFTTRGEERTAADVKREFGVEPLMLPQLKALAGDSDGYKPFPGLEKGKPGIGEKTAAAILEKFGSAEAAVKAALLRGDSTGIGEFEGLPSRTAALLRAGGEAALAMGLTCAKLRTDAPVPSDVSFGEWGDAEHALLDRQKAQQSEPRPEAPKVIPTLEERVAAGERATVPAATKAFQEAAHEQLTARLEYRDGSTVPITIDVTPVCPRCLGVEPGKPAVDPEHPHPGPFTAEVCAACAVETEHPIPVTPLSIGRPIEAFRDNPLVDESAPDLDGPCPDGKCSHTRGEHAGVTGDAGCAVVGCPCMHEDNPNFRGAEATPAPRKRRSSKVAVTPPVPDLEPNESGRDFGKDANLAPLTLEPKVFVLLTEAEFIALAPLPALAAAGLLTPPEAYADNFAALLTALREGAFRPCDDVFIGSVPEACAQAVSELSGAASTVLHGLAVNMSWGPFVDQLHVLPRFTDLAKYGGKLVRA